MAKLDPENVYFYAIVTLFLYGVIKPSKRLGGDPRIDPKRVELQNHPNEIPAIQVTYWI